MAGDTATREGASIVLSAIPAGERAPTFNEPWEAQTFAIAVALHRRGLFTWNEWTTTLGREIADAQARGDPDTGATCYRHWLAAIERLVRDKGIASEQTLIHYRDAWHKAADRTPHGEPIVLSPEDF